MNRSTVAWTLCLVVLVAWIGLAQAQRSKPVAGKPSIGVIPESVTAARKPPNLMAGKVTSVDQKAQTFTIMVNEVTFSSARLKGSPKVGEIVSVIYTQMPDGRMEATETTTFNDAYTRFGTKPAADPCAALHCIAPNVCGLDMNNQAVCVAPANAAWPRWCCWFGECRIGCGNRGYGTSW